MSWSVNGREYHVYEEYQRARARQNNEHLERLVQNFAVPRADTSTVEARLADAQIRRESLGRLGERLKQETADLVQHAKAQNRSVDQSFAEVARLQSRLSTQLEEASSRLSAELAALETQRIEIQRALTQKLNEELLRDREDEHRVEQLRSDYLKEAGAKLRGLDFAKIEQLGLEAISVKNSLAEAESRRGVEGLELARRALDGARELETEARWRSARLTARISHFEAEVHDLLEMLSFSPADRRELVGEGESSLDGPLVRELKRLAERARSIVAYEDHEVRFRGLDEALSPIAERTLRLASQVKNFSELEDARFDLVKNRLGPSLEKMMGEPVELKTVTEGAFGLHPVDARYLTRSGEIIDCTVAIDGSLRLHHHGHSSQASCAQAAQLLAEAVPHLMQTVQGPRLDISDTVKRDEGKIAGSEAGAGSRNHS